ncbi:MAG: HYR domain-containing protein [Bacteroidia bacterium]|nr:HYR domain-containing protein [Bacteroidia bacterium]
MKNILRFTLTAMLSAFVGVGVYAQVIAPVSGTIALSCGTDTVLQDNGGSGNYPDGCNSYIILYCSDSAFISLSGSYGMECGYDQLYVQSGLPGGPTVWNGSCSGTFTFTGDTGQTLTVYFHSDGSVSGSGFDITVNYSGLCNMYSIPLAADTTIDCGSQLAFTDAGGASGNYSNNYDQMVFFPGGGYHYITIGGTYQLEPLKDSIFLYNGIGDTGAVLLAYTGSGSFYYTTAVGSNVTFRLKSDSAVTAEGINITVKSYGACNAVTMLYRQGDTLSCGTNTTLFDVGGQWGNYIDGPYDWVTLECTALSTVTISGYYSMECGYEQLYIRDGAGPNGAVLAQYSCTGTMSYTGQPGQTLTVLLAGDWSVTGTGLELDIVYSGSCTEGNFPDSSGYTLNCGNNLTLYDDGGATGNYSDDQYSYIAFNNSGTGVLSMNGSYDLGSNDTLFLVHGTQSSTQIIQYFTGNGSINYTSQPGMDVALRFVADSLGTDSGYAITISYTGDCGCTADSIAPYFINVPDTVIGYSVVWGCGNYAMWTAPTVYDNCSSTSSLYSNHASGDWYPAGATTIIFTATDGINQTYDSMVVVIIDTIAPYLYNMPGSNTVYSDSGQCGAVYFWTEPNASDNCAIDTIISNYHPGDLLPVGLDTVWYTAYDASGNTWNDFFTVNVIDNEAPVIVMPANITVCENTVLNYPLPTAIDNCNPVMYQTAGLPPGNIFPVGVTTNCFMVTDGNANVSGCFTVTVYANPIVAFTSADDTICVNDASITLNATPAGGVYSGPFTSGSTIDPSQTGTGTFTFYYNSQPDMNGCVGTDSISITVDPCSGIADDNAEAYDLNAYPNPADQSVRITFSGTATAQVTVTDISGQVVMRVSQFTSGEELNLENLSNGAYLVRVDNAEVQGQIRIIVNH